MSKQLSDCCKAEIRLTGSPNHEDGFACIKCGRIIGTPVLTKVDRGWKEDIYTLMTEFMDRKLTPEDFMMAIEVMRNDAILTTKSQTRNDLLREIMEEMPKKMEENKHSGCEIDCYYCIDHQEGVDIHPQETYGFNSCHDQVNTLLERKLSTVKK